MEEIPIYPFNIETLLKNSLESNDVFYRRSVEMIDIGFNSGIDKITLFRLPDENEIIYLNLSYDRWADTLEDALKHFELIEDYEMCSHTKDVLERITG